MQVFNDCSSRDKGTTVHYRSRSHSMSFETCATRAHVSMSEECVGFYLSKHAKSQKLRERSRFGTAPDLGIGLLVCLRF
jgi:hypothetical protein